MKFSRNQRIAFYLFVGVTLLIASYAYLTAREQETQAVIATRAILGYYLFAECHGVRGTVTTFNLTNSSVTWTVNCGANGNRTNTTPLIQ